MGAAATLITAALAESSRLLADVDPAQGHTRDDGESPLERLEAALGRDLADRLVGVLSVQARGRLESALTPEFAEHIAAELAKDEREPTSRRGPAPP